MLLLSFTCYLLSIFFHSDSLAQAAITGTADDTDVGMYYSGLWIPDGDPHTFGSHDTWTNQTGASVAFDFIGTEIQVFATRRPEGTYLTNVSFSIDGGPADLWTTTDFVPEITYRALVYTSPALAPTQHRIVITNLGQIFWLDYVQWTTADAPPNAGGGGSGTTSATSSPSASQSHHSPLPQPTGTSHTSSTATSTDPSSASLQIPSAGAEASKSNPATRNDPAPGSPASATSAPTEPTPTAAATDAPSGLGTAADRHGARGSPSSKTPIVVGGVVGAVGALALLLAALWWLHMRLRSKPRTRTRARGAPSPTAVAPEMCEGENASVVDALPSTTANCRSPTPSATEAGTKSEGRDPARYAYDLRPFDAPGPMGFGAGAGGPLPGPSHEDEEKAHPAHLSHGASSCSGSPASSSSLYAPRSPSPVRHTRSRGAALRLGRHEQDAGVRLAGGPPDDGDQGQVWTPAGYGTDGMGGEDATLPPPYAQLLGHGLLRSCAVVPPPQADERDDRVR